MLSNKAHDRELRENNYLFHSVLSELLNDSFESGLN